MQEENEEKELFEHYKFTADPGQNPLRVDKFLMNLMEGTSRNRLQNAAAAGSIHVNGQSVKSNYKVKPNDVVAVLLEQPKREIELIAQDIPLNIVYEDEHLVVINKQAGLVVHPGHGNYSGTLVNALLFHFGKLAGADETRPGLVHRLDKDTTGIMVVVKDEVTLAHLAEQFHNRTTQRNYQAIIWGSFDEPKGTITGNLGRSLTDRLQMQVFPDGDMGKHAVTHYETLEDFRYVSLVSCKLETGRTHQIRAHMRYKGHPLFNDARYGGDKILKGTTFTKYKQFIENCFQELPRQALHAKSLGFTHPHTGKEMFFDSDLPSDMQQVLEKWRKYQMPSS